MFIVVRRSSTFFGRIVLTDKCKNRVLLTNTDKLIFFVRNFHDETTEPLIKKVITADHEMEGGYGFELTPEDTNLPAGTYYYDVGLQRENDEFYHVTMPDRFIIRQSFSRKED